MQTIKKITIIMPVYNDEKCIKDNIERVICELSLLPYEFDLVVVNDGSTDKTLEIVHDLAEQSDLFDYISYYQNEGKGHAFLRGISYVVTSHVLLIDSDLQIGINELPAFFNIMDVFDADVVVGNKRHPYSVIQYTLLRNIVSNTYNFICRKMFGIELRDTQCGFKLFKREALDKVAHKIKTKRFAFDLELLVALRENNFRIADAPVYMAKQYNAGSVSLKNIWETFRDTMAIWIRKKRGYYGNA